MLAVLLALVGLCSNLHFTESSYLPDPPSRTFSTDMRVVAFESALHPGVFLRMDCTNVKDNCGGTVNAQVGAPSSYERFVILPVRNEPKTFLIASAHFVGKYLSTFCENTFLNFFPNHLRCCGKASSYERFQAIDNEDGTISLRSTYFKSLALLEVWDTDSFKSGNKTHDYGFGKGSCSHYDFRDNHKFIVHDLSAAVATSGRVGDLDTADRVVHHDPLPFCSDPTDTWETVATCDNRAGRKITTCDYSISVGLQSVQRNSRGVKKAFMKKLRKSANTGFNWAMVPSDVFEKEQVIDESVDADPGTVVVVQQVIGRCDDDIEIRSRLTRKVIQDSI